MKLLILACGLLLNSLACGQNYFTAGYYFSIPMGDYGSVSADEAGFARTGSGGIIEYKFLKNMLPGNLSLDWQLSFHRNSIDSDALARSLEKASADTLRAIISTAGYHPFIIALGPDYEFPLGDKLALSLKVLGGLMFANLDPIEIELTNINTSERVRDLLDFREPIDFCYLLGTDLSYKLGYDLKLGLFASYGGSKKELTAYFENAPGFSSTSDFNFSFLNLGLKLHLAL